MVIWISMDQCDGQLDKSKGDAQSFKICKERAGRNVKKDIKTELKLLRLLDNVTRTE